MCTELLLILIYFFIILIVNFLLIKLLLNYINNIFNLLKMKNIFKYVEENEKNRFKMLYFSPKKDLQDFNLLIGKDNLYKNKDILIIGNIYKEYVNSLKKFNNKGEYQLLMEVLEMEYMLHEKTHNLACLFNGVISKSLEKDKNYYMLSIKSLESYKGFLNKFSSKNWVTWDSNPELIG